VALRAATHCGGLPLAKPPVVENRKLSLGLVLTLRERPAVPGGEVARAQARQGATGGGSPLEGGGSCPDSLLLRVDVVFEDATFGRPANAPEESNPFQGAGGEAARCAVSWHCTVQERASEPTCALLDNA
jgi:hypothetical protein